MFWTGSGSREITILYLIHIVQQASAEFGWPAGTYGLPEPVTGCPSFKDGFSWKRGYTYHNTEDESPANKRSVNYHFAGNFSQHGIQQRFCMKENPIGASEFWPEGKYCLYKKGVCPSGLQSGYIRWDDEHNQLDMPNKVQGAVPDGLYEKKSTTIKYCCSTRGNVNKPINLPNTKPFYLLTFGSPQCQKVAGTSSSMEFIKFDDNDRGNENKFGGAHPYGPSEDLFNTKIYYCYYEPGEESTEDLGTGKKVLVKDQKKSASGLGLVIGGGVAGAILGVIAIAFATKKVLASRSKGGAPDRSTDPLPDAP